MPEKTAIIKTSTSLFKEVAILINESKTRVKAAVNSELALLYWNIGKAIKTEILKNKRADYGEKIVEDLSEKLKNEFGKGYSRPLLFKMIQFFEIFNDYKIVSTLSRQLSWSHFTELVAINDPLKREFFAALCQNEGWSVRTLRGRIDSMLFERTALSKKPENTILNDLKKLKDEGKMSLDLTLRDPYILDFLNLNSEYSEADLETAILIELQNFILEMGSDFAFLARQKNLNIGKRPHRIDLLFYHRRMKRLVAIDLKLGPFEAGDKSQMELYLNWLKKHEMQDGEDAPIGLILCADKSEEIIELLELDKSGIHVAQYLTELPEKKLFKKKFQEAVQRARLFYEAA
ncbi:MAG: DUF1016 domain-containing protein [bacterium]|nr:DUF1016 domain-containing protein [bacterium]